ncbi:hypothetical protein ACJX0J_023384, partial [Zea mays]
KCEVHTREKADWKIRKDLSFAEDLHIITIWLIPHVLLLSPVHYFTSSASIVYIHINAIIKKIKYRHVELDILITLRSWGSLCLLVTIFFVQQRIIDGVLFAFFRSTFQLQT